MKLRTYQQAALDRSKERFDAGITRQLLSLPTGMGKTPTFAKLRSNHGFQQRIITLVHTEELADQAADKLRKWNPELRVGVEMGSRYSDSSDELVVASVPSIGKYDSDRINKFDPKYVDAIICDEAHHGVADSYLRVFNHFGLLAEENKKLLFGVTATPNRGDGQGLGKVFQEIVYQLPIRQAIEQGWLTDLRGIRVNTGVSLENVRVRAGDFQLEELSDAVDTPERNKLIVKSWIDNGYPRQTLVFGVDIRHAKDMAAAFQQAGVPAQAVWGTDPDRAEKLRAHRAGDLKVLTNANLLTEGYDDWRVGCIIMARPTKSRLLFTQMIGRGTRLPEGIQNMVEAQAAGVKLEKTDCLVIDVADTTEKHSLISLSSLMGMPGALNLKGKSVILAAKQVEEALEAHPDADLSALTDLDMIKPHIEAVDLFTVKFDPIVERASILQWYKTPSGSFVLRLPGNERVNIFKDLLDSWIVEGVVNGCGFKERGFADVEKAISFADGLTKTLANRQLFSVLKREAAWHKDKVSLPQINLLRRLLDGKPSSELVNIDELSKGEAAKLITKLQHQALTGK